jgi:cytochrome bd ubiquinol oxidase subunit II
MPVTIHVWAGLVAVAMILYVILDGITLGVGLLFPTARGERQRDILMDSIAPVWDANQTWLVFGGGAIFAAFPIVYGVLSSALYITLMTFIFGLIFRGVAFEFRANAPRKDAWNKAFFCGSLVAVVSQGLTLGGVLSGISVTSGRFSGGSLDWLNPFSIMVGIALIPGYVMLGASYLIIKTTGVVQERAYTQGTLSCLAVLGFMAIVTIWSPIHYPAVLTHWLSRPRIYFVWIFPVFGLLASYFLLRAVRGRREPVPLTCAVVLFLAGYLGLITSIYPYVIPPAITFYNAAAQPETLTFSLWGAVIVLPFVLAYTIYNYFVFRGKVVTEEFY